MIPHPPDWAVAESELDGFPWIRAMRGVPQDPVHHAEGDVHTHVLRVCREMAAMEEWRAQDERDRETLFWAALLHDVSKPETTITDAEGRLRSPHHSSKGALRARRILWERGLPPAQREEVAALVRHHQLPFWLLEREDPRRPIYEASQVLRCRLLALLAEADARGRECADQADLLDKVELFREFCAEEACLDGPRPFASAHARFLYFRGRWEDPDSAPYEGFRTEVAILCGLPGAGKDTWIRQHLPGWPVVSLDALRESLGVAPDGPQGKVVDAAWARARGYLRQGRRFAWNATNVTRRLRDRVVDLAASYGARTRLVHLEVGPEEIWERNRTRPDPVPERVLDRLIEKWEPPAPYEATRVETGWP